MIGMCRLLAFNKIIAAFFKAGAISVCLNVLWCYTEFMWVKLFKLFKHATCVHCLILLSCWMLKCPNEFQTSFICGAQWLSILHFFFLVMCTWHANTCTGMHTYKPSRTHTLSQTLEKSTRTGQCKDTNPLQLQLDQPCEALVLSPHPSLKK